MANIQLATTIIIHVDLSPSPCDGKPKGAGVHYDGVS